jgi:hypothetical protein
MFFPSFRTAGGEWVCDNPRRMGLSLEVRSPTFSGTKSVSFAGRRCPVFFRCKTKRWGLTTSGDIINPGVAALRPESPWRKNPHLDTLAGDLPPDPIVPALLEPGVRRPPHQSFLEAHFLFHLRVPTSHQPPVRRQHVFG